MKNLILILLIFYYTSAISQSTCKITYIANEGFLIKADDKKILIDALFGGFDGNWCDKPNDDTKSKLERAVSPFDNVDIIAISHKHQDHFNPEMVIKHIINNPKCIVVCPKQADSLLKSYSNYVIIKNNIIAITPPINRDTSLKFKNINIRILRLEHSHYYIQDEITGLKINKHENIENIGFVINVGGIKVFHCGDANPWKEEEYRVFNLKKERVDVALLENLFMNDSQTKEILNNYINPKKIILMHLEPNNSHKFKEEASSLKKTFPGVYIFKKSMEYKKY
ncbi:MAG: MBL fold metallo-hydrolase [Bacteroidales bacterium]|nr:MBL fold metallo-hydrolase [Bacteroidales bacterium]